MVFCNALNARYVYRCRTLLAVNDLKGYLVANLKVVEHNTLQFIGVEEKVLCFAFARNKTKSLVQQSLDCSCHSSFLITISSTFARIYYEYSISIIAYPTYSGNNACFLARVKPFIFASRFFASLRLVHSSTYRIITGLRARVYFAPLFNVLCAFNLRVISFVEPQYKVPSAHSRI